MTLEMLLPPTRASVSPGEGTSAQHAGCPGGFSVVTPLPSWLHAPSPRKQEEGAAGTLRASPPPQRCPSALPPSKPRHNHALTLNVCFLLMLSEGCTAATRKLRRGMLPRMLSSFSSGGQTQGLHARMGRDPRLPPDRDPRAAAGTRPHRSSPWVSRPPVGNRCLPVAPRQLCGSAGLARQPPQLFMPTLRSAARAEPRSCQGSRGRRLH